MTDQDYQLNLLSHYSELPRERTLVAGPAEFLMALRSAFARACRIACYLPAVARD